MKQLLQDYKAKQTNQFLPPSIILKDDVKSILTADKEIRTRLLYFFKIRESTLFNWLRADKPQVTDLNFIFYIFNYLSKQYSDKYKKLTDLLTIKDN